MSTETKHTSGPWMTPPSDHSASVYQEDELGLRGMKIADTSAKGFGLPLKESKANAKLISAAPDLLEALESAKAFAAAIQTHVDILPVGILKEMALASWEAIDDEIKKATA